VKRREKIVNLHREAESMKDSLVKNRELAKNWSTKGFCVNYIRLKIPAFSVEIDRIEAVQKFFRSLTVVFLILSYFIYMPSTLAAVLILPS
jgi:hypothetical protein